MDTLAVRLTVPLAGPVEDLHLQVIQFATTAYRIAPVTALRAMPGAQKKRTASMGAVPKEMLYVGGGYFNSTIFLVSVKSPAVNR